MMRLGYLIDWKDWFPDEDSFKQLTHINYAFATIANPLGTVIETFERAHQIKKLKEKHPHLTVSLSIGGWGADYFSETAADAGNRQRFIESTLEIVNRYDFDGVDIDWEYPCIPANGISASPSDKQNFTILLRELREALDEKGKETGKDYLLTIAAGVQMGTGETVELDKITQYIDYIYVMTYDLNTTGIASHHTNLFPTSKIQDSPSASGAIETFIQNGVPKEKLLLGIAFYGRGGFGVKGPKDGFGAPYDPDQTVFYTWTKINEELLEDRDFVEYWDDEAKASYLYNGDIFISYDNPQSVQEKVKYAKEKGLAGVFFWEFTSDFFGNLIHVIYEADKSE